MKVFLLYIFLFLSIPLYSQTYMNINLAGSYKSADVDDITEITFSADGTTMTTTTATSGNSIDAVSGITEVTFDATALGGELPVELTSFYAQTSENSITLFWTTATEVNNYGFEIQKQNQEKSWETISFVEGHGNSNSPKEYNYTDNIVTFDQLSYRLKQIDVDGTFEYSETITLEFGVPTEYVLKQNYPNPFNSSTTIMYQIPKEGFVNLKVYDVLGREVATLVNENKEAGKYSVEFNSKQLSSGTYFYRLTSSTSTGSVPEFTEIIKMILLK